MKTYIIQLQGHDDIVSARDKMGWAKGGRILLVWPERGDALNRRLDLTLLQRRSVELGAQLAIVSQDAEVRYHAPRLGIPVYKSLRKAQNEHWRVPRRFRTTANREAEMRKTILDTPRSIPAKPQIAPKPMGAAARLGLTEAPVVATGASATDSGAEVPAPRPVFTTEAEKRAARVVMDVIGKYEVKRDLVPTSSALLKPEVQKEILAEVAERLKPLQGELLAGVDESVPALDLSAVVAKTTEIVVQQTIDIPRIAVVPTGEVTTGFHAFKLDVSQLHLQPGQREIVGQMLRTNEQFTLAAEVGLKEQRPEDYIVHALVDFDDLDELVELLLDLLDGTVVARRDKRDSAGRWIVRRPDSQRHIRYRPEFAAGREDAERRFADLECHPRR